MLPMYAQKGGGKTTPQKTDTIKSVAPKPSSEGKPSSTVKPATLTPSKADSQGAQNTSTSGGLNAKPNVNTIQANSGLAGDFCK